MSSFSPARYRRCSDKNIQNTVRADGFTDRTRQVLDGLEIPWSIEAIDSAIPYIDVISKYLSIRARNYWFRLLTDNMSRSSYIL